MDVISLGKANKAKKNIAQLNQRLGENIQAEYQHVKERLEEIERKDPKAQLYDRVSEVSAHTSINLNKINLHIGSLINQSRYQHKEMIVDDFSDDSGVDYELSNNILYDPAGFIKQVNENQVGEFVTIAEELDTTPIMFSLSASTSTNPRSTVQIPLVGSHDQTEVVDNRIQLKKINEHAYQISGVFESDAYDMGENLESYYKLHVDQELAEEENLEFFVATSPTLDGFNDFTPINQDYTFHVDSHRYIKIKVIFQAKVEEVHYSHEEVSVLSGQIQKEENTYTFSKQTNEVKKVRFVSQEVLELTENISNKEHDGHYRLASDMQ